MYEHITKQYIKTHTFQSDGLYFSRTEEASFRLSSNSASLPATSEQNNIRLRKELFSLTSTKFPSNAAMEAACGVSYELIKKNISGKRRITRATLAKLCVGMGLSVEKAQELFRLEGHSLEPDINRLDAIVVDALQCGDDISTFFEECEEFGLNLFKA
jgi:hypothetical protein